MRGRIPPARGLVLLLALLLVPAVPAGTSAAGGGAPPVGSRLTKKEIEPYVEKVVSASGDKLLRILRIAYPEKDRAIVFFRYYSRYGHAGNAQMELVRKKGTGRWFDPERETEVTPPPG